MFKEQMTIGIISGLISAILLGLSLYLFRTVWKFWIEPWYENKLYCDARIDGEWTATLTAHETAPDCENVVIKQTGHAVTGQIECVSGPDANRKYIFTGVIRNQILSAYYWNASKGSIDSGSFSLHLEGDGNELNGYSAYYQDQKNNVVGREYKWLRKNKVA